MNVIERIRQLKNDRGWWYQKADGTYPASQWMEIGGRWYYFDAQGYMATGWVNVNGVYYYLDTTSGAMYASR